MPEAPLATWACSLLRTTSASRALPNGRLVHDFLIRRGHDSLTHTANSLIEMYGHCGSWREAKSAFDRSSNPSLFSWNLLIEAYGVNGLLEDARRVFDEMPMRDVVSSTAMISLFAQQGHASEALRLYHQMHVEGLPPNTITLIAALNACAGMCSLIEGTALHVAMIEVGCGDGPVSGTALINMYGVCRKLHMAWSVFSGMLSRDTITWNAMITVFARAGDYYSALCAFRMAPERNTASWNTMIGVYMQCGNEKMALELFHEMMGEGAKMSAITFVCVLNACAGMVSLKDGRMVNILLVKQGVEDTKVENALITMYGKCRSIGEARNIFGKMQSRDVISWTAMMGACTRSDQFEEALAFFHEMQAKGVQADEVTFLSSLDACALLSTLSEGQRLDDCIKKFGLEERWMVKTALINMYGKCGSLQEARRTFYRSSCCNIATWNAIMTIFAHNGLVEDVFDVLLEIQQHDVKPNGVTFSSVLTACSHAGWVDFIGQLFVAIGEDHGVAYTEDHYLCIVDIFARSGQLEQAECLIKSFPFGNDEGLAWQCLLAACKVHNDLGRALKVANQGFDVDPGNTALYTLLLSTQCCQ